MKHPLRVGQVFKCSRFTQLLHPLGYVGGVPSLDVERLEFDHAALVVAHWTEYSVGGLPWRQSANFDRTPHDAPRLGDTLFQVLETRMTGGGTGHGPHDVFPDGHQVVAREVEGTRIVRFYQSGCFVGMQPPENITLVQGPADEPEPPPPPEQPSAWYKENP